MGWVGARAAIATTAVAVCGRRARVSASAPVTSNRTGCERRR